MMKRDTSMEGIRGLAAMMVFLNHFCCMFYPAYYWFTAEETTVHSHLNGIDIFVGTTPLGILINGNTGVMFFLILTGFGTSMLCNYNEDGIRKYLTLRYFKLLLIGILGSVFVLLIWQCNLEFYKNIIADTTTVWFRGNTHVLRPYLGEIIYSPFDGLKDYNGILWPLKYMFWGSIIVVTIASVVKNYKGRYLLYGIAFFICFSLNQYYYYPVFLGMILADLYRNHKELTIKPTSAVALLLLGFIFGGCPTGGQPEHGVYAILPWNPSMVVFYHTIGAFCLCFLVLYCVPFNKFMNTKPIQILGKYSMAIYVVHYPILISLTALTFGWMRKWIPYNWAVLLELILTLFMLAIASFGMDKLIRLIYYWMGKGVDRVYGKNMG